MKKFILNRLKEPSTWRGIVLLVAGALGYDLNPDQQAAIVLIALSIVGAIGVFVPDKVQPTAQEEPRDTSNDGISG